MMLHGYKSFMDRASKYRRAKVILVLLWMGPNRVDCRCDDFGSGAMSGTNEKESKIQIQAD